MILYTTTYLSIVHRLISHKYQTTLFNQSKGNWNIVVEIQQLYFIFQILPSIPAKTTCFCWNYPIALEKSQLTGGIFVDFSGNFLIFGPKLTFWRQSYKSISYHFIDFSKNMVMTVVWFWHDSCEKNKRVEGYFVIFKSNLR